MTLARDKSAWKRIRFGDVIESVTDRVDDPSKAGVDRYVGLEHLDPGVMTVERWDRPDKVEAQKLRFRPGDVIFGRRRAYQRKVALAQFEGICSAHALVLRGRHEHIDPAFLPVFLSSDYFLGRAIGISVGSLSPTVNWRDLKVQEFVLPPLEEQARLADLIWAAERHRRALTDTIAQAEATFAQVVTQRLAGLPTTIKLGALTTTRSGPSFAASDVHALPVEGSVPVMGITNTKPNGVIDLEDVDYVTGLPLTVGRVDDNSLILIRTNGNRQRIGNVYLPPLEANGHAVSAFQFLMHVNNASDRKYLFWVLSEEGMQQRMSDGASGTVGLGNLAVRWLSEQVIPWSVDQRARDEAVEEFERHAAALEAIRDELRAASRLSKAVLAEALGGE